MKSTLPATHLLRHYLLFVLTLVFLLTILRSAYGLWQFQKIEAADVFIPFFLQGLRFDLALIGLVSIVPVVVGTLLSLARVSRTLAKLLIILFLFVGLLLVLGLELITPWFIETQGLRPDVNSLGSIESPLQTMHEVVETYAIPSAIAIILCLLIFFAFWSRMELSRFLRYRVSAPSGLLLMLFGGLLCAIAIWSTPDLRNKALTPADARISEDSLVNDLAMNTPYKILYSLASPYLEKLTMPEAGEDPQ